MKRCVVPLRTSVEWFDDPRSPSIEGRAKQAAVLYDEVTFEDGLLQIDVTDAGNVQFWLPPEMATEEVLREANRPIEVGAPVSLSIAVQEGRGVPADPKDATVMMSGPLRQRYVAELMYSVVRHVVEFNDGWATVSSTGDLGPHAIDASVPFQSSKAVWDSTLMPGLKESDPWLRDFAIKSFDRDAALASALDADLHVSQLFSPVMHHRATPARRQDLGPIEALEYLFPDVTNLPWEVVMEFREHDASIAARAHLQDAVERAREHGLSAADTRLTRDLFLAEKDLRRRHTLAERVGKIAASFVPLAGSTLAEGVEAGADVARAKKDWGAALALLKR